MKILTKKKQEEILKRITANSIIYTEQDFSAEGIEYFTDNEMEIAFLVGGYNGMSKVINTVQRHFASKMGGKA